MTGGVAPAKDASSRVVRVSRDRFVVGDEGREPAHTIVGETRESRTPVDRAPNASDFSVVAVLQLGKNRAVEGQRCGSIGCCCSLHAVSVIRDDLCRASLEPAFPGLREAEVTAGLSRRYSSSQTVARSL